MPRAHARRAQGPVTSRSPICTSAACSRTDSAASSRTVSSARAFASGPRCAHHRADDLGEQADLPVGGGPERTQVPAFDAEPGHVGDDLADRQRVVVVVTAGAGRDQAELLEFGRAARRAGRSR